MLWPSLTPLCSWRYANLFLPLQADQLQSTHVCVPAKVEGQALIEALRLRMDPDLQKRAVSAAGLLM